MWIPPKDPPPPAPSWINARAFASIWREQLAFVGGGLAAAADRFPNIRPGKPWRHRPEPDSEADIEQAIGAKLHLSLHALPILAEAEVALIEPPLADLLPEWETDEAEAVYAARAQLPVSPLFLDFESRSGLPAAWHAPTWPLPLHLRGALCWQKAGALCVMPYGSVGGVHPWGGSDYHPWARWIFLQGEDQEWLRPGPGDFISNAKGDVLSWVDSEQASICAHQGALAYNLCRRALRVLQFLEFAGGDLVEPRLPRPVRRRAARERQRIARIPEHFPVLSQTDDPGADSAIAFEAAAPCVVERSHSRLEQAHTLWHEALAAYHDPEGFVIKLNALLQALRSVTFVLRKEFGNSDDFQRWYSPWEDAMRADARMKWAVEARNAVEKRGDLDALSVAQIRVVLGGTSTPVAELDVDPAADSAEISRRVKLLGLPSEVRRDGIVEVERRWTLPDLPGDELLDVLAYCWGFLARIVDEAHRQRRQKMDECDLATSSTCGTTGVQVHPTGRRLCMVASREERTSRRYADTGVPYQLEVRTTSFPPQEFDDERARKHYRVDDWVLPSPGTDVLSRGRAYHEFARHILIADGYHSPIAWLLLDGARVAQAALHPEDQRDKAMMMQRLALEVDRLGADEFIFTTEAWEAQVVADDDPRSKLRPADREDRREALLTYALARGGPCNVWRSGFARDDKGAIRLQATEHFVPPPPPFLGPLATVWATWAEDSTRPAD